MVKHIVMWKIKDTDDKQQNIDRMINMLTSLVGKINGLVSMEMGHNFNNSSEYDVVLYATFKNVNALKYYQNHPEHVKCKEFISGIQTGRVAADYFFEDDITKSKPFNEVPDAPEPIKKAPKPPVAPKVQEPVKTAPKSPAAEKTSAPAVNATIINKKKPVQKPEKKTYINVSAEPVTAPKAPAADTKKPEVKVPEIEIKKPEVKAPEAEVKKSEPDPFDFSDDIPAAPMKFDRTPPAPMKFDREPAPQPKPQPKPQTAPQKMPVNAQVNPVSTEHSKIKETTNVFGKKKIDVDVTPLEQRSDTWTCPNCGKIMPNYVGTCGCGEIKPFDFGDDDVPAAPAPKAEAPAPKRTPISRPTQRNTVKESKSFFGNKKTNTKITPVDQDANTWTCPNCGKVMPNYVGTCGCGETKPFDFNISDPTENSSLPQINMPKENAMSQEMKEAFENAQPSIRGYNPQINKAPQSSPDLNYIKNDNGFTQSAPSDAPDISFMQKQDEITKNNNTQNTLNANQNYASPLEPIDFGDDNIPAVPMRFDDVPPAAPMRFDDVPPAAPMRFNSNAAPAPAAPAKPEKKRLFGKKAKEEAVFQQAQAAVNSRKDVPNNGTWTCPNCGKVMPKYVGTCGCGEQQPFDF